MATPVLAKQIEVPKPKPVEQVRLLNWHEKLFGCRDHDWSVPFTTKAMVQAYADHRPYNSHQNCNACGQQRFYNTKTMTGGPRFKRLSGK